VIFAAARTGVFSGGDDVPSQLPDSPTGSNKPVPTVAATATYRSTTPLYILTCSAVVAVYVSSGSNTVVSLGLSSAVLASLTFLLVERAIVEARQQNGGSVIYSANGLLTQPDMPVSTNAEPVIAVMRDVSAAAAIGSGVAALTMESLSFGGLAYYGVVGQAMGNHWMLGQAVLNVAYGLSMAVVHMAMDALLLIMVSDRLQRLCSPTSQQCSGHLQLLSCAPACDPGILLSQRRSRSPSRNEHASSYTDC